LIFLQPFRYLIGCFVYGFRLTANVCILKLRKFGKPVLDPLLKGRLADLLHEIEAWDSPEERAGFHSGRMCIRERAV